jgi:hypothetical protein
MARTTLMVAGLLIVLGVGFYFGTGMVSVTALIPAAVGLLMGICGLVALKPGARKHAMHVAVLVALLGAVAVGGRLVKGLGGAAPAAVVIEQVLMLILCVGYVAMGIRSFVAARRRG